MERLISVLDGDAKRAVAPVEHSGLFYASALKLLKQDFGNPLVVSYKKQKQLWTNPKSIRTIKLHYGVIINL